MRLQTRVDALKSRPNDGRFSTYLLTFVISGHPVLNILNSFRREACCVSKHWVCKTQILNEPEKQYSY